MPYIEEHHKPYLDPHIDYICGYVGSDEGKMNYVITKILLGSLPCKYRDYNMLIGVLECAKQELYRRAIAPYEDKKIKENGDVYNVR